ncbi:phycobilin lyase, CpcS-I subunit [Stanieria cyanosphaera PCC 7437]|uniref:Chromophore lyase CpcS/CpeS n=1 Tax=Stanieria cyanosphaera (strain ATCC 29371 / PCC 7437) TaxID=111780 RepID=K9XWD7_STAC7|nr:phycobiliprotein lyase [Stanieria cyanosphaera]AFZ36384.1 phycobilin lyase, CpcS-I subunit [Stanieria cyanosphaera PCC 7437]
MNQIKDAMEFFQRSAGQWRSQRTTHHLPFRRAETGGSQINVEYLAADHPKIIEICQMHEVDPSLAIGGAFVSWDGSMAWDKEDENHEGTTVFALIPEPQNPRKGKLLRERGYAEIVPVAGLYEMDQEDGLVLITEYDTMSTIERFWFVNPNLRLRTSTVQRFGGFNTATFCAESRVVEEVTPETSATETNSNIYAITGW